MRSAMDSDIIQRLVDAEKIHNLVLMHDDLRHVMGLIDEIIAISKARKSQNTGDLPSFTENICLIGEAGTGKTTLSNLLKDKYPNEVVREKDREIFKHPILFTSIQNKSINGLANAMLQELGDFSHSRRNEKTRLTQALEVQLRTAQTELIIFDEFHELFSLKNRGNVTSWIKALINKTGIPILAMGTPGVEALISHSDETARRFKIESLNLLAYDYYDDDDEFSRYVEMLAEDYMETINMESFYKFDSHLDYLRLYLATNGYPSNIAELYKEAAKDAIRQGKNIVEINNLAQGFRAARRTSLAIGELNPFNITEKEAKAVFQNPIKAVG